MAGGQPLFIPPVLFEGVQKLGLSQPGAPGPHIPPAGAPTPASHHFYPAPALTRSPTTTDPSNDDWVPSAASLDGGSVSSGSATKLIRITAITTTGEVGVEAPRRSCASAPDIPANASEEARGLLLAARRSVGGPETGRGPTVAAADEPAGRNSASALGRGRGRDVRGIEAVVLELRVARAAMSAGDPDGSRCARMSSLLSQLDSYRRGVERRHGPAHALATQLRILHADMSKWLQARACPGTAYGAHGAYGAGAGSAGGPRSWHRSCDGGGAVGSGAAVGAVVAPSSALATAAAGAPDGDRASGGGGGGNGSARAYCAPAAAAAPVSCCSAEGALTSRREASGKGAAAWRGAGDCGPGTGGSGDGGGAERDASLGTSVGVGVGVAGARLYAAGYGPPSAGGCGKGPANASRADEQATVEHLASQMSLPMQQLQLHEQCLTHGGQQGQHQVEGLRNGDTCPNLLRPASALGSVGGSGAFASEVHAEGIWLPRRATAPTPPPPLGCQTNSSTARTMAEEQLGDGSKVQTAIKSTLRSKWRALFGGSGKRT